MSNTLQNIFLMRHAESAGNADLNIHKQLPDHAIGLTAKGWNQAANAGLEFSDFIRRKYQLPDQSVRIWCSPYLRTIQTCDSFLSGIDTPTLPIFKDFRTNIMLAEQDFGLFDGREPDEIKSQFPVEHAHFQKHIDQKGKFYARPPMGESRFDVAVRIHGFFGTIWRDAEKSKNPTGNIFVVSHGATIRAFVMMWLHKNPEWFDTEKNPRNASIRHIGRDENGQWKDMGYIFKGFSR
ncbi:MAG: histidine phosphatase family protein [Rickettsiales bacterium]|jgi:2,3-bisphosphoglycerate-dependent phosphoglycerate mutase|nr:histidine phosphatase family protein [Rickettsiales bacterium]